MSEEKLKPCPFCGGEAHINSRFYDYMRFWGECKSCYAANYVSSPNDDTRESAIKAWNTRRAVKISERNKKEGNK